MPELGQKNEWVSESIFSAMLISFLLWTFSPFWQESGKRFYTAVLYARVLMVLVSKPLSASINPPEKLHEKREKLGILDGLCRHLCVDSTWKSADARGALMAIIHPCKPDIAPQVFIQACLQLTKSDLFGSQTTADIMQSLHVKLAHFISQLGNRGLVVQSASP